MPWSTLGGAAAIVRGQGKALYPDRRAIDVVVTESLAGRGNGHGEAAPAARAGSVPGFNGYLLFSRRLGAPVALDPPAPGSGRAISTDWERPALVDRVGQAWDVVSVQDRSHSVQQPRASSAAAQSRGQWMRAR